MAKSHLVLGHLIITWLSLHLVGHSELVKAWLHISTSWISLKLTIGLLWATYHILLHLLGQALHLLISLKLLVLLKLLSGHQELIWGHLVISWQAIGDELIGQLSFNVVNWHAVHRCTLVALLAHHALDLWWLNHLEGLLL